MFEYLATSCDFFPSQIPVYLPNSTCSNSRLATGAPVCQGTRASSPQGGLGGGQANMASVPLLPLLSDFLTLAQGDLTNTSIFSPPLPQSEMTSLSPLTNHRAGNRLFKILSLKTETGLVREQESC